MRTAESILEAIVEQAKQGSCRTCRWCVTLSARCEAQFGEGVRLCEIQSNVNPIDLRDDLLNAEAYPGVCHAGDWQAYPGICLAYVPGDDTTRANRQEYMSEAAREHTSFMYDLADAIYMARGIRENTLAKLTAKLNEAKESLPVQVKA